MTLIVGPVFPHEVVGFSGGNKYLFPGVSGQELIDVSHWLGALITSADIIGTRGITPVRALIDEAASLVPGDRYALCLVVGSAGLHAAAFGEPRSAWAAAADVAAETHVRYLDAPVRRVLSLIPHKYEDMWTGAKGFYKVEPIVADGGQVVIYAPHIREVSAMHPHIVEIGYHCRDYFVGQWDRFKGMPWGDLAHSTHLRGAGTYDPVDGERLRVTVTLATGIPEDVGARDQPRLPGPRGGRPRRLGGRPRHARRAPGRRGPLPAGRADIGQHGPACSGPVSGAAVAVESRRQRRGFALELVESARDLGRRGRVGLVDQQGAARHEAFGGRGRVGVVGVQDPSAVRAAFDAAFARELTGCGRHGRAARADQLSEQAV